MSTARLLSHAHFLWLRISSFIVSVGACEAPAFNSMDFPPDPQAEGPPGPPEVIAAQKAEASDFSSPPAVPPGTGKGIDSKVSAPPTEISQAPAAERATPPLGPSFRAADLKRALYDPNAKLVDLFGDLEPKLMLDAITETFWESCPEF